MKAIDITRPLYPTMAVWPGDTLFSYDLNWAMEKGSSVNVGTVKMSIHTGTHVDAPFHYQSEGKTIDHIPLDTYIGPAQVVHLPSKVTFERQDFEAYDFTHTPRLLIRTDAWPEGASFPEHVPTLAQEAIQFLAHEGVVCIGLDLPSVDDIDSKTLDNHHTLTQHQIAILEGLDLSHVEEGTYELVALPLKIKGADGSPVRAILRHMG
ncbi:arylformamidase [Caldalkalibacillus salinus]|uniref:arylformamidase n=1 Tax=Caldalkalibacillus salinus TaxID=2803787 RepID=UPI001921308E|nr:arylformamidase [Caldalkalibacillus salinus]